jgi:lysozyme|tara:strand:+ start:2492 stop:3145 length:654 start_codon:yes stop_codon:yes gene_type:complete
MKSIIITSAMSLVALACYCKPAPEPEVITETVEVTVWLPEYILVPYEVPKIIEIQVPVLLRPSINNYPVIDYEAIMVGGVKYFEGFKPRRYRCCAGVPTIGYGCTIRSIVSKGEINQTMAAEVLEQELSDTRNLVQKYVTVELTEHQLNALTSFAFNCGMTNLKKLVNGSNRLNDGNYDSVERLLPMYRKAGGKVREGLVKRRKWEVSLWRGELSVF